MEKESRVGEIPIGPGRHTKRQLPTRHLGIKIKLRKTAHLHQPTNRKIFVILENALTYTFVDGFNDTSILSIVHPGIVAGAYDFLHIAEVIDATLPKTDHRHLSHSQGLNEHLFDSGVPVAAGTGTNR